MTDSRLYPPLEPFEEGPLEVGSGHTVYWERSGMPAGLPVILLHGGPGTGLRPDQRRVFDPTRYHIIGFDQRGCGRSVPLGLLEDNNLRFLVDDVEQLRQHLGIDAWLVSGGSWGSTLALAYGARYPERCLGFLLRGIFLCRSTEIEWWLYGMRSVFPEFWEAFACLVPQSRRHDLVSAYQALLENPASAYEAATTWKLYERSCGTFHPSPPPDDLGSASQRIATARIHTHYFANGFFTDDKTLLAGVRRFRHVPSVIIHGRYDMICPVANAYDLAECWGDNASLEIITETGHSFRHAPIIEAMLRGAASLADRIRPRIPGS